MPHKAVERGANIDRTPADTLERVATASDRLSVTPDGELMIESVRASDLLQEHGSPLYVVSEDTLRTNFRRVRKSFSEAWPTAISAVLHCEYRRIPGNNATVSAKRKPILCRDQTNFTCRHALSRRGVARGAAAQQRTDDRTAQGAADLMPTGERRTGAKKIQR